MADQGLDEVRRADPYGVAFALEELRLAEARLDRRRQGHSPSARERAAARFVFERADGGDPATPRQLADHLGVSQSTVTEMLVRLTAVGVVATRPHPVDGRSKVLVPVSRNDHVDGVDALTDRIRAAVAALSDEQAEGVRGFLEHLRELVDRADPR